MLNSVSFVDGRKFYGGSDRILKYNINADQYEVECIVSPTNSDPYVLYPRASYQGKEPLNIGIEGNTITAITLKIRLLTGSNGVQIHKFTIE